MGETGEVTAKTEVPGKEGEAGSPAEAKDGPPRASRGDVLEMKERDVSSQRAQNDESCQADH